MAKAKLITAAAIIIVIAAASLMLFLPKPSAVLVVDEGTVEFSKGEGWLSANSGMELKEGWEVRTGEGGKAHIIFFEGSVMRLDSSTHVKLTDLSPAKDNTSVGVYQQSGRTWNRVVRLSGLEGYEVTTPTAVASVRGTAFGLAVDDAEGDTNYVLDSGFISLSAYEVVDGEMQVTESQDITERSSGEAGEAGVTVSAFAEDEWVAENLAADQEWLAYLREQLKRENALLISAAKARSPNLTDEAVDNYIDGYLEGEFTVEDAVDQGIVGESEVSLIPEDLRQEGLGGAEADVIARQPEADPNEVLEPSEPLPPTEQLHPAEDDTVTEEPAVDFTNGTEKACPEPSEKSGYGEETFTNEIGVTGTTDDGAVFRHCDEDAVSAGDHQKIVCDKAVADAESSCRAYCARYYCTGSVIGTRTTPGLCIINDWRVGANGTELSDSHTDSCSAVIVCACI
jgi:hypothetical protein